MPKLVKALAFVAYETPLFPCGGITAVIRRLPHAVQQLSGCPTLIITPFHISPHGNNKTPAAPTVAVDTVLVPYHGGCVPVTVRRLDGEVPTYLLEAGAIQPAEPSLPPGTNPPPAASLPAAAGPPPSESPFFAGERHPYDCDGKALLRDALFFGAAVAQTLAVIERDLRNRVAADPDTAFQWRLVLQDWETATAALAVASAQLPNVRVHLTLHNSYDAFAPDGDWIDPAGRLAVPGLARVGIDPARCPGNTILDRAFARVEWPVYTVSEQFAVEFTSDVLQRDVLAPQLQGVLSWRPLLGVDNGLFKSLAVPADLVQQAAGGAYAGLAQWKADNRGRALAALAAHTPTAKAPVWGDKDRFRRGDAPWLVMAGRDDPRQKGFDVAAAAIADYLEAAPRQPDRAQFLFFPIPGDENLLGLQFLKQLAERFPEDVLVFPFLWSAGFAAALRAAAFGLMPSLYEPFGMANEFYLDGGCVGIGRATGGNLEQIVPLRAAGSCSAAVRVRAARYHALSAPPTGLLFRERDDLPTTGGDWHGINGAGYDKAGGEPSRVTERRRYALYNAMAQELRVAIEDGIRVVTQEPELYYRMLAEGIAHLQRTFSWHRAAQEYVRYLT